MFAATNLDMFRSSAMSIITAAYLDVSMRSAVRIRHRRNVMTAACRDVSMRSAVRIRHRRNVMTAAYLDVSWWVSAVLIK